MHLEMSLLLNLIGGYDKLLELAFREKITYLACLLGSGLNIRISGILWVLRILWSTSNLAGIWAANSA